MKSECAYLMFAIVALVLCGAAEEMFPKPLGVGFPFLFCATVWFAVRAASTAAFVFALAAGTAEDALAGLPFVMSASYFVLAVFATRFFRLPGIFASFFYFGYQFWLWLWVPDLQGSLFMRGLLALPVGAGVAFCLSVLLDACLRGGGLDEK